MKKLPLVRTSVLVSRSALALATLAAPSAVMAQSVDQAQPQTQPQPAQPSTPRTPPPQAGEQSEPESAALAAGQSGESKLEIVVTGFRASAEDAVNVKRDNINFTDSVSSEGLDRFPDLNVGEALTRIPGIQLNREADSRDATVNLRGLPGSFAIITLNGLAFGDPVLSGSTPLGAFSSDIFSRLTVIKSPGAADQAGGLSGIIDLRINTALNRKQGGSLRISQEYNELGKRSAPSVTLSYNKRFGDRFGIFAIGSYRKENFRRDTVQINNYSTLSALNIPARSGTTLAALFGEYYAAPGTATGNEVATPGGTGTKSKLGVLYPSNIRQIVKDNVGQLLTGAAGAEYEFSNSLKASVTGFYTKRDLTQALTDLYTISLANTTGAAPALIVPDASTLFSTPDGRNYIERFTFTNANLNASKRRESSKLQTWGINPRIDFANDEWRATTNAVYSRAYNNYSQLQVDNQLAPLNVTTANPFGNGITGSIYTGAGDIRQIAYSVDQALPINVPGTSFRTPGTGVVVAGRPLRLATPFANQGLLRGALNTPYTLQIGGVYSNGQNVVKSIQQDLERTFDGSFIKALQVGIRYEDNVYDSEGFVTSAIDVNTANVTNDFLEQSDYIGNFFGGKLPGVLSNNWQTINQDVAVPALRPVTVTPGLQLTPEGFVNNSFSNNYLLFNYTNTNRIFSAFGLAKLDFDLVGIRFRGNGGLRYERTKNELVVLDRESVFTPNTLPAQVTKTLNRSYDYLLPSAIVAADLTSRLVFRVGRYKTYVRPQRRELSPVTAVNPVIGAGATTLQVTIGNVNIRPYTAWSTDVALEWYNRRGSLVAVNYFRKSINDFITPINDVRLSCPADGLINGEDYGLGTLTFNSQTDQCISSNRDESGNPVFVTATGNVNNPNPVTIEGLEFNIQQNFSFLPGFLKNFGGQANYSRTTVDGRTSGGAKVVLNGVSKNNYNFILFYETRPFGIRAVYNFRDKYELASLGTFTGPARTARPRGQLDLSASIRTKDGFSFGIDAFNLTNALREDYEQVDRVLRRSDYDGRTVQLTVRKSF